MLILQVTYIAQTGDYDCWHAALRMVYKFRHGQQAEPPGHGALVQGQQRDQERRNVRLQFPNSAYLQRKALRDLPPRGLNMDEFEEMAGQNQLAAPLFLQSFKELRDQGGLSAQRVEELLNLHGPLWCARVIGGGYPHVVVVIGVNDRGEIVFHDPQVGASLTQSVEMFNKDMAWGPFCLLYMPA